MENDEEIIGFAKYSGKLVEDGYMDARKSAQALLGFDKAVRFFVYRQAPDLQLEEFEFPVKIRKGSWEIVVGAVIGAYGIKAAQKMAEKDFEDIGFKDVLKKSLNAIQWVIRLGKHLGDVGIKKFENVTFKDNNELIGIPNSEGEILYVPKEYFEYYISSGTTLLKKMSEVVENERTLSIGVYEGDNLKEETLTRKHRQIFTQEESSDEDFVLPELVHGQEISIEAEVTRGNETSNTIGIGYGGHIITGIPLEGSIVRFKPSLFLKCIVNGYVTREENGTIDGKRPKIIVSNVVPIEPDLNNLSLFNNGI